MVHATLNVGESLTSDSIQELLDSVGISRQEVIIHVHQGRDLGVFSTRDFEGNGGYEQIC